MTFRTLFLFLLFLKFTHFASAQCSATASKSDLCIGDATRFSHTSSKTVTSAAWDFGNGQSSTSLSPLASFQNAGRYSVICNLTFTDGSTCTDSVIIKVHNLPNVTLEIDTNSVYCRDVNNICLNDKSTTGAGNAIVKRHFIWGDGNIDFNVTSRSACHKYTITNKKIELGIEVFDSFGCADTAYTEISFDPVIYTNLSLNTLSETCENGSYCIELETSPSSTLKSVQWTKNGAAISPGAKDCFTSSSNFSSDYKVKVENTFGCFSYDELSLQRDFEKSSGPPSIVDDTICFGNLLEFELKHPEQTNDSFSFKIINRRLIPSEVVDTVHYPAPFTNLLYIPHFPKSIGKYEFHIKSLNPIRQDCALDTIVYAHVRGPLASPILTNSSQCVPRDTVFFSDGSAYYLNSTALGYYWDFGDSEALNQDYVPYNPYQFNQFSTMKDTKHFYQKIGCYGGTFTVVDSITGCSNNTSFLISTSNVGKFNLSVADKQSVYCETDTIHFIANLIGNNYQEIDQNHIQNPLCPGFSILSKETYYGDYGRERKTGLPVYRFKTDSYCEPQDVSIVSNDSTRKYYFANGSNTPTYVSDSVCYIENNFNDLITVDNNPEAFLSLVKATPLGCEKLEIDVKILTHDSVQAIKLKWTDGDSLFYQFDTLTMWDTTLSITVDTGIYKMYHTFYSKCSCETLDSISFGGGLSMKPIIRAICGGSHFDIDYEAQYLGDGYSFTGDSLKESYNWQFDTLGWTRNMDTMIPYDTFGGYNLRLAYSDSSGNCIDTITTLVPVKKVFADFSSSNDEIYCKKLIDFYDESIVKDSGSITQWSWNLTDGNSSSEKNPFKLFKLKGTYDIELIATSLEGCKDTVKKEIILDGPNPVFALKSDTIGCKPLEVKLADRSTNNKLQIWEWNDRSGSLTDSKLGDDSINVFTYTEPGIYCPILRVYDTVYTRDNYHVCTEFFPDPDYNHPKICVEVVDSVNLNFEIDNVACTGQSIDLINNNQNINLDYYYHNGDTNLVRSWNQYPYYNVEEKGGYINFVFYAESRPGSDYPNCSDTFRKSIEVQDPDIDMDFCLNSKDLTWKTINVNTNSEYITKYLWESDHGTIKDRRKSTATISYESNVIKKTICLTGWTSKGCENSICKDVYLPNIELFNVFTPNSDNQNNSYDIVTKELTSYHIEIYNRYGELVFKSSIDGNGDSPHNWNGKNMNTGIPVPEGTYFYILKYKVNECKNETHTIEGTVDLIR